MTNREWVCEVLVRNCPKCGRSVTEADVICPGCDFVLDTGFLGEDVTGANAPSAPPEDHSMFGKDAVILGSGLDGEFESFEAEDTGMVQQEVTNARIYVGGNTQALLAWDAILGVTAGIDAKALRLSPYEKHVLQFVNGRRPVGRIRKKSGMEPPEFKLALAMMADKGVIEKIGIVDEERRARARARRRAKLRREARSTAKVEAEDEVHRPEASATATSASSQTPEEKVAASPSPAASQAIVPTPQSSNEATRVEALPGSLVEALREEKKAAAAQHQEAHSAATMVEETRAADDVAPSKATAERVTGRKKPKRRRPRLPANMRRSLENKNALSEHSGLDESHDGSMAPSENEAPIRSLEATAVRKGPVVNPEDVQDVFSSADAPGEAVVSDNDDMFLEAQIARNFSVSEGDRAPPSINPPTRGSPQDNDQVALEGKSEATDPSAHLSSASFSIDLLSGDMQHGAKDTPPPLPADHSRSGPVANDVHDLPTGPIAVAPRERSIDDSLLPTGEGLAPDERASEHPAPDHGSDAGHAPDTNPTRVSESTSKAPSAGQLSVDEARQRLALPSQESRSRSVSSSVSTGHEDTLDLGFDDDINTAAIAALFKSDDEAPAHDAQHSEPEGIDNLNPKDGKSATQHAAPEDPDGEDQMALAEDSDEGDPVEVSFEMQRKAARIFEEAEEEWAQGKKSSACMNVRLAMIYDPSNKTYKRTLTQWQNELVDAPPQPVKLRTDVRLYEEARLAESRGQYEKACGLLKRAIDVNPKAAPVYNLLGVIQATRLKAYQVASDNILRACEIAPSNLSFKNNLGKVLAMQEAVRDLSKVDRREDEDMVKVRKVRPKMF